MAEIRPRGLRIAMVGQRGVPATFGGVERHVEELGARLVDLGHEVTVYCRPTYVAMTAESYRGMTLRRLGTPDLKYLEAIVHSAGATVAAIRDDVDIIHYHALGPGLISPAARGLSRAKIVQTVHGLDHHRAKWGRTASAVLQAGCWTSAHVPHATVVVSSALQDFYARRYDKPTSYIRNGVVRERRPSSDAYRAFGVTAGRYVLFVGRLVPEKAPDRLLRAFAALPDPDLRLVIAGASSFTGRYVEELTALAATDPRVVMAGGVYDDALHSLYDHAGAFVLPSDVEGMPLTLLEAAWHGLPLLASDIEPHVELLGADRPGRRLFRRGSEADLTLKLAALVGQLETERAGARADHETLCSEFDWDRSAQELSDLYLRLADRSLRPRRTRSAPRRAPLEPLA